MHFSKAFDSVKHNLLVDKLKNYHYIINWYISFLEGRQHRDLCKHFVGDWKMVNKGTTQGEYQWTIPIHIFLNDLEIKESSEDTLCKYADDSTIIASVRNDEDCSNELVS